MSKIGIIILSFFIMLFFSACSFNNKNIENSIFNINFSEIEEINVNDIEREKNIRDYINTIDKIIDNSVIVSGNNIIVGIKTNETKLTELKKIKKLIKLKIKEIDKWADNISVTFNNYIIDLIENIN